MPQQQLIVAVSLLAAAAAEAPSFDSFLKRFGLGFPEAELPKRQMLYQQHLEAVAAHNAQERRLWAAGINELCATTDEEFAALRGHKEEPRVDVNGSSHGAVATAPSPPSSKPLLRGSQASPKRVDWREHLPSVVTAVKNQGQCGSCWAFATTEVLESHAALATGVLMDLAPQQLTSCTPFPPDAGGCAGSSTARALDYVLQSGIDSEWRYPYISGITGSTGECFKKGSFSSRLAEITGYAHLRMNDAWLLKIAVTEVGPVAVVVDARKWKIYESGIFDGCSKDRVEIDHAVVLMGYGEEKVHHHGHVHWWLIRNSWGTTWGEEGYIRLRRYPDDEPCSNNGDHEVCGECGVLSNSVLPSGTRLTWRPA